MIAGSYVSDNKTEALAVVGGTPLAYKTSREDRQMPIGMQCYTNYSNRFLSLRLATALVFVISLCRRSLQADGSGLRLPDPGRRASEDTLGSGGGRKRPLFFCGLPP